MDQAAADRELLERIRSDEPEAFDQLVDRYGDRIFGFGMRMCGEREDARDVLQETLMQAYRSLKGLKHPKALGSWLYRVAANACLMKRRKGKYEPERELSLEELAPGGEAGSLPEIPDLSNQPDDALERSRLREAVRQAVLELPSHYRIVLVLRDMEHLPTREVAGVLDLPETTVKMRLHRARLMVKQRLEEALTPGAGKEAQA
jgi:RNA polymerase sigma-70 factor (ECF subfamily)